MLKSAGFFGRSGPWFRDHIKGSIDPALFFESGIERIGDLFGGRLRTALDCGAAFIHRNQIPSNHDVIELLASPDLKPASRACL